MTTEALVLITEMCTAILAVAGVLAVAARVFLRPRIAEVDAALGRIEAHLVRLNGSVGETLVWQHQHEIEHARRERQ